MLGIRSFNNFSIDLWQGPVQDFYCDRLVKNEADFYLACSDASLRHIGYVPEDSKEPGDFFSALYQQLSLAGIQTKKRRISVLLDPSKDYFKWRDCHLSISTDEKKEITSLKELSYYRTGGTAAHIFLPKNLQDAQDALIFAQKHQLPVMYLGAGTNSLVMDTHWDGCVIALRDMQTLSFDPKENAITAEAGACNSAIARFAFDHGLVGAGWMNGLPGQIGATTRMNARCYGGEISQIVFKIEALTPSGDLKIYETDDLSSKQETFLGYKNTVFMTNGELITKVYIKLQPAKNETVLKAEQEKMLFCLSDRQSKGQFDYPSCGCVFKNNYDPAVGMPSGKLLEQCGAKQLSHQGAAVSPHHGNFVFNKGSTSRGILELTLMMRQKVFDQTGIWLEYEMEILGHIPEDLKEQLLNFPTT